MHIYVHTYTKFYYWFISLFTSFTHDNIHIDGILSLMYINIRKEFGLTEDTHVISGF